MKIVFLSNVRGRCGTTLHTTCMATIHAMFSKRKVIMMENHDHLVNIESCIANENKRNIVREKGIYNTIGLEKLMELFEVAIPGTEENIIKKCAICYANNRLYYLPHNCLNNSDILNYQFSKNIERLLQCLERYYGTVYIDAFSNDVINAHVMLESADIIVVNLNQNNSVLKHYFRNFSAYKDKSVYLLGNYYQSEENSIIDIRRRFQIQENKIFAIPYCREAAEAESQGNIVNYIVTNYLSPSINSREFINALHEAYNGIINYYSSSTGFASMRGLSLM